MGLPIVSVFGANVFQHLVAVGAAFGPAGAFISPLSIYIALALALNGATPGTNTYSQLWTPLANSITPAPFANLGQLNRYTRVLQRTLIREARAAKGTEMMISNALFSNRTLIAEQFKSVAKESFNAPVINASSAIPINKWVKRRTNNLIEEAVPNNVKFKLMAVNAIYFFGSWVLPWNKTLTSPEPFTTPDGKTMQVHMMRSLFLGIDMRKLERVPQIRVHKKADGQGPAYKAAKLTYRESNFSAITLMCDEAAYGLDAAKCLNDLDIADVIGGSGWRNIMASGDSIDLPRFEVEVKQLSVTKALKKMGVDEPFSDRAQFGRLSPTPLMIDDIYHSTVVKVDEEGTEAAAVTAVVFGPTAIMGENLLFNRPFVFLVYDEEEQVVLFMGVVNRPTPATK